YGAALLVATGSQLLARQYPGLSQPLLAFADFKWAAYFILTFATFVRPDSSRILWFIIFMIELGMAFGGYFSSFRNVFQVTLIALIAAHTRTTIQKTLAVVILGAMLLSFALAWTAVKVQYRSFVSGGVATQAVVVNYTQSVEKLAELLSNL